MRFEGYFKLSSYLLVLCGFSSLVLTRFYSIPFGVFFLAAVIFSWKAQDFGLTINIPKKVWNAVTVAYFLYVAYDVFFASGDLIGEGINFTVYLQIHRLLNLRTNRDYFILYLLSFLHLLSASVLTESISFSVPFFLYIILATWTFTIYNLKTQYEESLKKDDSGKRAFYLSRETITRRFLFATSMLSLLIIVTTMIIFFSFPRMSLGYFYKNIGQRKSLSGFSENVDLGSIGSIMKNHQVVMRVEFPEREISPEWINDIYWRGTAFDIYDGRKWSRRDNEKERKLIDSMSGVLPLTRDNLPGGLLVQKIFLEPLDTRIVFAADEAKLLRWEKLKIERYLRRNIGVERDAYDTNYFFTDLSSDQQYFAYSSLESKTGYIPHKHKPAYPADLSYLDLPYRDKRTEELVSRIVGGAAGDYEKASRIEDYLKKNFLYSDQNIDVRSDRPVEEFLFRFKRGHCEFFSTAMSMMLRYAGIPSRNVVGFRGGAINEVGDYVAVRQSDAHSWVEAYIYGNGWRRFDPTPGEVFGVKRVPQGMGFLSKYVDYLKLRWSKYIIDYDLRTQAQYTRLLWVGTKRILSGGSSILERQYNFANMLRDYAKSLDFPRSSLLALIAAAGVLIFMIRLRKGRGFGGRAATLKVKRVDFYSKTLKILAKKGIRKDSSETPMEFGYRLVSSRGADFVPIIGITRDYYENRFGDIPISPDVYKRIEVDIQKIRKVKSGPYGKYKDKPPKNLKLEDRF